MRSKMWDNESQEKILNLTSHIVHPTSAVQNLSRARPVEFRNADQPKAGFHRASA